MSLVVEVEVLCAGVLGSTAGGGTSVMRMVVSVLITGIIGLGELGFGPEGSIGGIAPVVLTGPLTGSLGGF